MTDTVAIIGAYSHYPVAQHLTHALAFGAVCAALIWIVGACVVSASRGMR